MADINHHIAPLIPAATHAYSAPSPRPPFVDLLFPFLAHKAVGTGWTATHTHQTISTRAYSDTRCLPPGAVPRRRPIISAEVDVALPSRLSRCHHGACRRQPHSRPLAVVSCLVSTVQALPRWLLLTPHRRPDTAKDNLSPSPRRLRHGLGRVWKQAVLPHRMWVIRPQTPPPRPYSLQLPNRPVAHRDAWDTPRPPLQAWAELDFPKEEPASGQFGPFTFFPPRRTLDFYDT
ncbi:hypothetical protein CH63R_12189 [Colletotrichum higginsianum IMI 349063]|uniref:Uncharacterized protein n=1 Tax=Colletotrichum higginsianum (strain IMI 349063) TaxID=759273 RepID=A0A1B7Y0E1_COLHI|nr:hypothetical protein CH63R_12189 [Colletotrichum higginsianum IMI 349063]OBR05486.1 hypothetical protein CH63R_12189 [Colletotrichum higginsianum IMI 349063]